MSPTNKNRGGGGEEKKNKQTREEGKKDKGAGVSVTDYKPKSYLEIYYVYMPLDPLGMVLSF